MGLGHALYVAPITDSPCMLDLGGLSKDLIQTDTGPSTQDPYGVGTICKHTPDWPHMLHVACGPVHYPQAALQAGSSDSAGHIFNKPALMET